SSLARSRAALRLTPAARSGTRTFSSAVRPGTRLNAWNTMPTLRRRYCVIARPLSAVTSTSPTVIWPEAGVRRPPRDDSKVVFPQPLGPSRMFNDPGVSSRLRPSIGRMALLPLAYSTTRLSMRRPDMVRDLQMRLLDRRWQPAGLPWRWLADRLRWR